MQRVSIPADEYRQRVQKAAELVRNMGLDALIVNSTEADYADVRYFSGFWPAFERAGFAISAAGDCALMVGMESGLFAADFSNAKKIFVLREYRESADPETPEAKASTYTDVLKAIGVYGRKIRIGVASWLNTTLVMLDGLKQAFPAAEIVRADSIMARLRSIKSENEIACIRQGFAVAEYAIRQVVSALRPGVTEAQMVGVAQKAIYEMGAEYEALPLFIFGGRATRHAISRARTGRLISKDDILQLGIGGRVDGYSPCKAMPVCMGRLDSARREYIGFALKMHNWTKSQIRPGAIASDIAKEYHAMFVSAGYGQNFLYGPCHGTGMIEVEPPWMETSSDYALQENMTFQVDSFLTTPNFGIRWEIGVAVRPGGCDELCEPVGEIIELDF